MSAVDAPAQIDRRPKRNRRERVPVLSLREGDICEVNVVVEGDERDWVERTVIGHTTETVTFKAPEGWEQGEEYTITPAPDEEIWLVRVPQDKPLHLADRVLGNAVHPNALDRLFEIWPDAHVEVQHDPPNTRGRGTRITIYAFDPATASAGVPPAQVKGAVTTWHRDQFVRKVGTRTAFQRALKKLQILHAEGQVG